MSVRQSSCPRRPSSVCRAGCPSAARPDHAAAHVVASHPEQGWSLLCNGVVLFTDGGELLPDGRSVPPVRAAAPRRPVAA